MAIQASLGSQESGTRSAIGVEEFAISQEEFAISLEESAISLEESATREEEFATDAQKLFVGGQHQSCSLSKMGWEA